MNKNGGGRTEPKLFKAKSTKPYRLNIQQVRMNEIEKVYSMIDKSCTTHPWKPLTTNKPICLTCDIFTIYYNFIPSSSHRSPCGKNQHPITCYCYAHLPHKVCLNTARIYKKPAEHNQYSVLIRRVDIASCLITFLICILITCCRRHFNGGHLEFGGHFFCIIKTVALWEGMKVRPSSTNYTLRSILPFFQYQLLMN